MCVYIYWNASVCKAWNIQRSSVLCCVALCCVLAHHILLTCWFLSSVAVLQLRIFSSSPPVREMKLVHVASLALILNWLINVNKTHVVDLQQKPSNYCSISLHYLTIDVSPRSLIKVTFAAVSEVVWQSYDINARISAAPLTPGSPRDRLNRRKQEVTRDGSC